MWRTIVDPRSEKEARKTTPFDDLKFRLRTQVPPLFRRRMLWLLAIAATIGGYQIFMAYWLPSDAGDWEIMDPKERPHAHLMLHQGDILQEIVCSRLQSACFYVIDSNWAYNRHTRRVVTEFHPDTWVAARELQPVGGDAFTKSNAQKWAVHPTALLFDCHKVFGSAPFVTGIMKSGSPPAKILSIGLGGGSIDSFFLDLPEKHEVTSVELDPAIKYIAQRWYHAGSSRRQSIVVKDGVVFIKEASDKGLKYDAVFVDVAYAAVNRTMAAPVEEFFLFETVQQVRNILEDKEVKNSRQMLIDAYRMDFKQCFYAAATTANLVLVCTTHDVGHITSMDYLRLLDRNVPKHLIKDVLAHLTVLDYYSD
ncbi:Protein Y34B4A.7 [Aphelenchoides avenae]|nr:Protein Y34B4A.7 [Aphelenchus avenae]